MSGTVCEEPAAIRQVAVLGWVGVIEVLFLKSCEHTGRLIVKKGGAGHGALHLMIWPELFRMFGPMRVPDSSEDLGNELEGVKGRGSGLTAETWLVDVIP